ncbi:copper resistance protein CopC [Chthonobacter rhizosphaerae]|uniref:copper resistance CopC/CopD family protein n=1 Tax=Chthonobacter rhizosphaerae TaxID=2735553 RepID=UPI0015EEB8A7|nr:copper resistance protein CopC [Chthonobacter rhizosphaerae]
MLFVRTVRRSGRPIRRPGPARRLAGLVAVWLAFVAAAGVATTGPALAHAALVRSAPVDGAVLQTAPEAVHLVFTEPVSALVVRLLAPRGDPVDLAATTSEATLAARLPKGLGPGSHTVVWRVISADGHPIGGTLVFSIGAPSAVPEAGPQRRFGALLWAARALFTAGLLLAVGVALARAVCGAATAGSRRIVAAAAAVGTLSGILLVGLSGVEVLGAGPAALRDPAIWLAGGQGSLARAVVLGLAALAAAVLSLRPAPAMGDAGRPRRHAAVGLAVVGLGLAAAAFAVTGHAASAPPSWLFAPLVAAHAVAAALWIGGLAALAAAFGPGAEAGAARVRLLKAFAVAGPVAIVLLVVSGGAVAVRQVERPEALLGTDYGRVLVAKLVMVGLMLALAAANRWRLVAPAGSSRAPAALRVTVGAELLLAVAVLAVVGLWRFTPPPRALHAAAPVIVRLDGPAMAAEVTATPGRAGPVRLAIVLSTPDGRPVEPLEVTVEAVQPDAGLGPIRRPATRSGGAYAVHDLVLPAAGPWQVTVRALLTPFDEAVASGSLPIAGATPPR